MFKLKYFQKFGYKPIFLAGFMQTFCIAQIYAFETDHIHFDGFLRAGSAISDSNTKYIERVDSRWDWGNTHFGLNFQTNISPTWDVAGQIFGSETEEHFKIKTDWIFGRFHDTSDHWTFKIGKLKYPNNLVSEYYDLGTIYPWVRPPQEFYSSSTKGIKLTNEALTGAIGEYSGLLNNFTYSLQLFSGETEAEEGEYNSILGSVAKLESEYMMILASYQHSHADFPEKEFNDHALSTWNLGLWLDYADFVLYSEYGRSNLEHDESVEIDHHGIKEDGEAGYVTIGYRISSFLPYATYSFMEKDNNSKQKTVSAGLKYSVSNKLSAKIQWEQITPSEGEEGEDGEEGDAGLFEKLPEESKINIASFAFDFVF